MLLQQQSIMLNFNFIKTENSSMKKTLLTLALLTSMATATAQTLVTVNGLQIDSSLIDQQVIKLQNQSNGQITDSPQLRDSLLNRAVVHAVIVHEARRLKLDQTSEYKEIIAQVESDAKKSGEYNKQDFNQMFSDFKENLLEQAFAVDVLQKNPVTNKDVRAEYNNIAKFYKGSYEVQLAEIVTHSESDAKQALSELNSGKSFAEVAAIYTVDEEGKRTGGKHLGFINLKDMAVGAPELHSAIKDLSKGQYTKRPLNAEHIWAIFSVTEKRQAQVPSFEQMKDSLMAQLQDQRVNKAIESLMKKANIQSNM